MEDFKQDELIEIKLPRKEYLMLREMLQERSAYSWLTNKLKSLWIFAVAAGVLTIWALGDKIKSINLGG